MPLQDARLRALINRISDSLHIDNRSIVEEFVIRDDVFAATNAFLNRSKEKLIVLYQDVWIVNFRIKLVLGGQLGVTGGMELEHCTWRA